MESATLIEEMMILANQIVAEKLVAFAGSKALLRKHDPFSPEAIKELTDYFRYLCLLSCSCSDTKEEFDLTSSLTVERSLEKLRNKSETEFNCVGRKLMTKLKAAAYTCIGAGAPDSCSHYALNLKMYTHFTSPIRRYADIIVHRLLEAAITNSKDIVREHIGIRVVRLHGLHHCDFGQVPQRQERRHRPLQGSSFDHNRCAIAILRAHAQKRGLR